MEKSDIEILETDVGGQKIKDLSALAFIGFISRKIDGHEEGLCLDRRAPFFN